MAIAQSTFGRADLAVESYHMGIGNLTGAVQRYAGAGSGANVRSLVSRLKLSYAKLAFDSTPIHHAAAYNWISQFGDDSSSYYWRVLAARRIMQLYRTNLPELQRVDARETAAPAGEAALLPPSTPSFDSRGALAAAKSDGTLSAVPIGTAAEKAGIAPDGALHLRPEALAALLYIAAGTRALGTPAGSLQVTAATTDTADLAASAQASHGLSDGDPAHATGYAFDIARRYVNHEQALAFQFMLDRLSTLNLITWQRYGREVHVVAGPGAAVLNGVLVRR
jgi:hypothetical protein